MRIPKEIELKLLDMSAVLKPSTSHALVLEEVGGEKRKVAVIIGPMEAQVIQMARIQYKPPRPFTHDLMLDMMKKAGLTPVKALIYDVTDGIFSSMIHFTDKTGREYEVDSRTSDALALSLRAGFPLYIFENLLEREKLRHVSEDGSRFMMSVNSVDLPTLRIALQQAIDCENYERASELRDEIRYRESQENADMNDDGLSDEGPGNEGMFDENRGEEDGEAGDGNNPEKDFPEDGLDDLDDFLKNFFKK